MNIWIYLDIQLQLMFQNSEQTLYFCFDDLTLPLGPLKYRLRQSIGSGTWTRLPRCLGRWWFSIMIEKIIPRVIIGMGLIESYDCWLSKSWLLIDECWLSKSHGPTGIWLMWYCMRVSWNAGSPSHHGCFNTKSWSSVTGFGWDKLAKSFQINSNCAHMPLKILVAFPSHLQKNDWYELIWLFDDRRHEMLSLFFKWDADSVGRRPDGSNIPSVVSSNMAGNLQKRKFFFASKIIELNGEFPIAMFDYWRVRNWTVGQWATCTIFIHFPLVPSKEKPQGFGVWMNSLRVFGSAVLAGHGQPFLSST